MNGHGTKQPEASYCNVQNIEHEYLTVMGDDQPEMGDVSIHVPTPRPTQPMQPMQPVQPMQPMQPVQPVQPVQPMQPVQLVQPMRKRGCKQPPWWSWLQVACVLGMLVVHTIVSKNTMTPVPMDTAATTPSSAPTPGVKDCQQAYNNGCKVSGVYTISPDPETQLDVYCDQQLDGGGWLVFQARRDGSVDFYQNWTTYKAGFGNLMGEFWLGNTNIHLLTKHLDQELMIELTNADGEMKYANYRYFSIGDESQKYRLNVTEYSGGTPPGDSMVRHTGSQFSTKDQNNDDADPLHCAPQRVGGWWYKGCNAAKLNARFGTIDQQEWICWYSWKPVKRLTATRMMVRRRS